MKKIKYLLLGILLLLTGCFNSDSMENIKITTTVYPFEYVVNFLYGKHSDIKSIYPKDTEINDFNVTNILLDHYSDTDLYIFNGLINEKNYISKIKKGNKKLKIIDVTSNIDYKSILDEIRCILSYSEKCYKIQKNASSIPSLFRICGEELNTTSSKSIYILLIFSYFAITITPIKIYL